MKPMKVIVSEATPQTGRWRGTILGIGDSINMTDLGRNYTLPPDPHCVLCEKPLCDGDKVTVMIAATEADIRHTTCWLDGNGEVHTA